MVIVGAKAISGFMDWLSSDRVKKDLQFFWWVFRDNPRLRIGLIIISIVVFLALFAPLLAPYDPQEAHPGDQLQPPSGKYWLGTDNSGMDILSRLVYAPRIDLTIAVTATLLAIAIGVPLGLMAGYYSNVFSEATMRVADLLQSFPVFILGMALVVLTGQRIENIIIALAVINAPIYARLTRSQALHIKERLFVEAAKAAGSPNLVIIFRHLLPNSLGPVFAQSSVTIGFAILLTAGLSFVGAGVRIPTPEWGSMIAIGAPNLMEGGKWWPSVFPGLALSITTIGFGMIGDSLAELTDPRRRRVISHG
jgi:peptide/nickel transport system permease protein